MRGSRHRRLLPPVSQKTTANGQVFGELRDNVTSQCSYYMSTAWGSVWLEIKWWSVFGQTCEDALALSKVQIWENCKNKINPWPTEPCLSKRNSEIANNINNHHCLCLFHPLYVFTLMFVPSAKNRERIGGTMMEKDQNAIQVTLRTDNVT